MHHGPLMHNQKDMELEFYLFTACDLTKLTDAELVTRFIDYHHETGDYESEMIKEMKRRGRNLHGMATKVIEKGLDWNKINKGFKKKDWGDGKDGDWVPMKGGGIRP